MSRFFCSLVSRLISASRFLPALSVRKVCEKTNLTGRRARVYLAPDLDEVCSRNLLVRLLVQPV